VAPELAGARHVALLRLACEFNLRPERSIHPSRWPAAWPARYRDMALFGERGRRVVAAYLLAQAGLAERHEIYGEFHCEFSFDSRAARLALLPPAALMRLGDALGLVLHRAWLTESGSRRVDKVIAAGFGGETLDFVLQRTPPFDAFGETLEPLKTQPKLLVDNIRQRGARLLTDFVAPAGAPVQRRMRLKLPLQLDAAPAYLMNPAQRRQVSELLFLCLIPERLPSWDWLF
jgi:type III secretion protein K